MSRRATESIKSLRQAISSYRQNLASPVNTRSQKYSYSPSKYSIPPNKRTNSFTLDSDSTSDDIFLDEPDDPATLHLSDLDSSEDSFTPINSSRNYKQKNYAKNFPSLNSKQITKNQPTITRKYSVNVQHSPKNIGVQNRTSKITYHDDITISDDSEPASVIASDCYSEYGDSSSPIPSIILSSDSDDFDYQPARAYSTNQPQKGNYTKRFYTSISNYNPINKTPFLVPKGTDTSQRYAGNELSDNDSSASDFEDEPILEKNKYIENKNKFKEPLIVQEIIIPPKAEISICESEYHSWGVPGKDDSELKEKSNPIQKGMGERPSPSKLIIGNIEQIEFPQTEKENSANASSGDKFVNTFDDNDINNSNDMTISEDEEDARINSMYAEARAEILQADQKQPKHTTKADEINKLFADLSPVVSDDDENADVSDPLYFNPPRPDVVEHPDEVIDYIAQSKGAVDAVLAVNIDSDIEDEKPLPEKENSREEEPIIQERNSSPLVEEGNKEFRAEKPIETETKVEEEDIPIKEIGEEEDGQKEEEDDTNADTEQKEDEDVNADIGDKEVEEDINADIENKEDEDVNANIEDKKDKNADIEDKEDEEENLCPADIDDDDECQPSEIDDSDNYDRVNAECISADHANDLTIIPALKPAQDDSDEESVSMAMAELKRDEDAASRKHARRVSFVLPQIAKPSPLALDESPLSSALASDEGERSEEEEESKAPFNEPAWEEDDRFDLLFGDNAAADVEEEDHEVDLKPLVPKEESWEAVEVMSTEPDIEEVSDFLSQFLSDSDE